MRQMGRFLSMHNLYKKLTVYQDETQFTAREERIRYSNSLVELFTQRIDICTQIITIMKVKPIVILLLISFSFCTQKVFVKKSPKVTAIDLISMAHKKKEGINRGSSFYSYDERVYEIRKKAIELYNLNTDTALISRLIVIDLVNFEGSSFSGAMIVNDTARYYYKSSYRLGGAVNDFYHPIISETILVQHLKARRFAELESMAKEKGKMMSGSNFFYIGMFEKGIDSVYVKVLPAFISN